jgi:cytidylate kinase
VPNTTPRSSSSPIITIDGPTASGKGTIARAIAKTLSFHLLDSGAIYRAFALAAINRNLNSLQINELENEAKVLSLEFRGELVWLDGADATHEIRSETVGMMASKLSAIPEVRRALMDRQRAFAKAPGLVADGRDMGTIVFPDAALKIFLTATAETRAERRYRQLQHASTPFIEAALGASPSSTNAVQKNTELGATQNAASNLKQGAKHLIEKGNSSTICSSLESFATVLEKIQQRDAQDKNRDTAPTKPAPDAIVIDNAAHGPQQTIAAVLSLWRLRSASSGC